MTVGVPMMQLLAEAVQTERDRALGLLLRYEQQLQAPQPDADCSLTPAERWPREHRELLRQLIAAVRG